MARSLSVTDIIYECCEPETKKRKNAGGIEEHLCPGRQWNFLLVN